ncbi:MAG: ATP-binding protein [Ignavibacteriae bacterium]|nr:ATP-binding protein [Ignavibacteriota bacterium]
MLEQRHFIQIITGPRQVGKTTLIKQLKEEISLPVTYFSADNVSNPDSGWIDLQWDIQRTKFQTSGVKEYILVFDEIQKISNWSEAIKKQWGKDTFENRNIKLILLGSSQMLLQKGISESLAGRFELIPMAQWSFSEMNEAFGFTELEYLWFGGYPGGAVLKNDEARWKEYILNSLIEPTLYKDILLTTRIDKPALLRKLFELGCSYSGQIVTFQKILGQLDDAGNTTTLSHYLSLLDLGGLLSGIEKYSKEKIRQRASSPKWQVRDNALLSVMSGKTFDQVKNDPAIFGRFVESAIGTHLLNSKKENKINLYYWREGDKEVDYIIEYDNKIISIEVKSSVNKSSNGLYEFRKKYNPHKSLIIEKDGLQWNDFIKIDPRELF